MLVLQQNLNEKPVVIRCPNGDVIKISIGRIGIKAVRVCYEAPKEYKILRDCLID